MFARRSLYICLMILSLGVALVLSACVRAPQQARSPIVQVVHLGPGEGTFAGVLRFTYADQDGKRVVVPSNFRGITDGSGIVTWNTMDGEVRRVEVRDPNFCAFADATGLGFHLIDEKKWLILTDFDATNPDPAHVQVVGDSTHYIGRVYEKVD